MDKDFNSLEFIIYLILSSIVILLSILVFLSPEKHLLFFFLIFIIVAYMFYRNASLCIRKDKRVISIIKSIFKFLFSACFFILSILSLLNI